MPTPGVAIFHEGSGGAGGELAAGPGTAIADNKLVRGDTTGVQGSGVDLSDADAMSGLTQLTCDSIRLDGHQVLDTGTGSTGMLIVNGGNNYIELRGNSGETWFRNDGTGNNVGIATATAGATAPNLMPSAGDPDTGVGRAADNQLSLIAGAVEGIRLTASRAIVQTLLGLTKTSSAAGASTTEYPNSGDCGIHHNTTTGVRSLAFNDGGVLFTVPLA